MLDGVAVTCHAAFSLTCTVLVGVLGIYFPRLGSSSGLWMEITWSSLESPPNLSLRTRPCSGSARNPVPCSGRDVSRCGGPCRAVAVDSDPARSCPPRRPGAPDGPHGCVCAFATSGGVAGRPAASQVSLCSDPLSLGNKPLSLEASC